jgi:myosin V
VWRGAELLEDYRGQDEVKVRLTKDDVAVGDDDAGASSGQETVYRVRNKRDGKEQLPLLRNPDILIGENDLTTLSYLNEAEVLYNLRVRFVDRRTIYTYCGIVLVAVNPYEELPLYSVEMIHAYEGKDLGQVEPHIFAVAEEAYKRLSR